MVIHLKYGSGLGEGLSSLGSTLGAAIKEAGEKALEKREGNVMEQVIAGMPENPSAMDIMRAYTKVPKSQREGFTNIAKIYEEDIKTKQKSNIENSGNSELAIRNMFNNNEFTGPVAGAGSFFSPQTRMRRQYYDSLALELEKRGALMVGKGTLNRERFNFLKNTLPSSGKTQASNIGALKAWADELKIDIPELNQSFENYGTKKSLSPKADARRERQSLSKIGIQKPQKGTVLDEESARKILQFTNNDETKAMQLAEQLGYKVQ